MKTTALIIKEGRVCCTDKEVPEKPKEVNCGGTHACTCAGLAFESGANRDVVDGYDDNCPHRYTAALQLIKDNAVPFENQDAILKEFAYQKNGHLTILDYQQYRKHYLKEDTFYPVSVEVEIITVMSEGWQPTYNNPDNSGCEQPAEPIQLARIVEEPVEKKPDFIKKAQIEEAKLYVQEQGLQTRGAYRNGESEISLPYLLAAYHHDKSVPVNSQVEDQERILCAAIWYDDGKEYRFQPVNIKSGIVVSGLRHPHCKIILNSWLYPNWQNDELEEQIKNDVNNKEEQGFITSKQRFVNRKEGAEIFQASGGTLKYQKHQLFSEDLY
jgi:hypothetical protein